ncbi:hypothetical protein [Paenibacillus alvei]|uniref:hypothetical protein n=1 Tax=Paenibacillus alvei TaxID=44250 RepID=UPI000288922D|nr:hypothetical protein [Paenibacillus alvei]EJW14699.1 hypothetical protein PAV_11c00400 [Paenibacillus alvei DSM 29]MCY9544664.1 hypothetical protein [Paenibacillus alvei]MCY9704944.1 hypothetical protein [Paenibacillus alvei]MEC0080171.1 hypothetical protein [Paenibacillus alvei]NEZ43290.1 hypothetical protein [Paenibacillus alvei]
MLDGLLETIKATFPESDSIQEKLNRIELKSAFRSPESSRLTWIELAQFIKTLQIDQLALLLSIQSKAIYFSDGEKEEILRSLSKHKSNIHKFMESDRTTEPDKAEATIWLENTRSAFEKLKG